MRVDQIAVPDSAAAIAAREVSVEYHSPALLNHCERSYAPSDHSRIALDLGLPPSLAGGKALPARSIVIPEGARFLTLAIVAGMPPGC